MSNIKILLAEDDSNLGILLKNYLTAKNYETTLVRTGTQALDAFSSGIFSICIFDIMMPEIDGFITSSFIKKIPDTENIPIVFLTARKTMKGLAIALKAGAVDYITKPFSPKDLLKRLRRVLDAR